MQYENAADVQERPQWMATSTWWVGPVPRLGGSQEPPVAAGILPGSTGWRQELQLSTTAEDHWRQWPPKFIFGRLGARACVP